MQLQWYWEASKQGHHPSQNGQWQQYMPCDLAMSMHQLQSLGFPCIPRVILGESHHCIAKNGTDHGPTFSIFVICLRMQTKTFFTSCETVSGEGILYAGRPVFIRGWNPQSFTILKGCLLPETQHTLSALDGCIGVNNMKRIDINGLWCTPGLTCCMLSMSIGYFVLADTFKFSQDQAIP